MSVCVFVPFHILDIEAYFSPTSRSRMTKNFRDSESLGKSNGKKWSQIYQLLLIKGVKSPRKKKFVFRANFALLSWIFLVSVFLTPFNGLCAPTSGSPMSKLFLFSESFWKSNGKKWSQIYCFEVV